MDLGMYTNVSLRIYKSLNVICRYICISIVYIIMFNSYYVLFILCKLRVEWYIISNILPQLCIALSSPLQHFCINNEIKFTQKFTHTDSEKNIKRLYKYLSDPGFRLATSGKQLHTL